MANLINLQSVLSDLAPGPTVLVVAAAYALPWILIVSVLALIALAIVLIVRASRRNKAKRSQDTDKTA